MYYHYLFKLGNVVATFCAILEQYDEKEAVLTQCVKCLVKISSVNSELVFTEFVVHSCQRHPFVRIFQDLKQGKNFIFFLFLKRHNTFKKIKLLSSYHEKGNI